MSDNRNNVHFSGVRFICSPYLAIKSALAFARADDGKMRAANESYALKMNIIVILSHKLSHQCHGEFISAIGSSSYSCVSVVFSTCTTHNILVNNFGMLYFQMLVILVRIFII